MGNSLCTDSLQLLSYNQSLFRLFRINLLFICRIVFPDVLPGRILARSLLFLFFLGQVVRAQDAGSGNDYGLVGLIGCRRESFDATDETAIGADAAKDNVLAIEVWCGDAERSATSSAKSKQTPTL